MYTTYLFWGMIIYVIARVIMTKGASKSDEKIVTSRFKNLVFFSFLVVAIGGFNEAIRFGSDQINFFDWLYNMWAFLKYFIQIPLIAIAGYHFFNFIYENEMTSIWKLKANHFALAVVSVFGWVIFRLFYFLGINFLKTL